MATAHVQHTSANANAVGGVVTTSNFGSSVTGGNCLAVWFVFDNGGGTRTFSSLADTGSNTYTQVILDTANASTMGLFYAKNVTGGASFNVTVTVAGGNPRIQINVHEVSGADTTAPLGQSAAARVASSTTPTTGGVTTTTNGEYIFGNSSDIGGAAATVTAGGSYTKRVDQSSSGTRTASESQIQTSAGSIDINFTWSAAITSYNGIMTLKEATAGGRTTKNTRSAPLGIEIGMNWRGAA